MTGRESAVSVDANAELFAEWHSAETRRMALVCRGRAYANSFGKVTVGLAASSLGRLNSEEQDALEAERARLAQLRTGLVNDGFEPRVGWIETYVLESLRGYTPLAVPYMSTDMFR